MYTPSGKIDWLFVFLMFFVVTALIGLAVITVLLIRNHIASKRVSRFFAQNNFDFGVLREYSEKSEEGDSILIPIRIGDVTVFSHRVLPSTKSFCVALDCQKEGKTIRVWYLIPPEDYGKEIVGAVVKIKDEWEPSGYAILNG